MSASNYVIQIADKSFCPTCTKNLHLLCRIDGTTRAPWFYICFDCKVVAEVGKGIVNQSEEPHSYVS